MFQKQPPLTNLHLGKEKMIFWRNGINWKENWSNTISYSILGFVKTCLFKWLCFWISTYWKSLWLSWLFSSLKFRKGISFFMISNCVKWYCSWRLMFQKQPPLTNLHLGKEKMIFWRNGIDWRKNWSNNISYSILRFVKTCLFKWLCFCISNHWNSSWKSWWYSSSRCRKGTCFFMESNCLKWYCSPRLMFQKQHPLTNLHLGKEKMIFWRNGINWKENWSNNISYSILEFVKTCLFKWLCFWISTHWKSLWLSWLFSSLKFRKGTCFFVESNCVKWYCSPRLMFQRQPPLTNLHLGKEKMIFWRNGINWRENWSNNISYSILRFVKTCLFKWLYFCISNNLNSLWKSWWYSSLRCRKGTCFFMKSNCLKWYCSPRLMLQKQPPLTNLHLGREKMIFLRNGINWKENWRNNIFYSILRFVKSYLFKWLCFWISTYWNSSILSWLFSSLKFRKGTCFSWMVIK